MKSFGLIAVMAAAVMIAAPGVHAQAAASSGSMTVQCNDGTSQTVTTTKGACHGHKGINKSASGSSSSSSGSSSSNSSTASSNAAAAPAAASKSSASSSSGSATKSASTTTPAAGGGPDKVWVNTGSKTKAYHCQGDKYYGTTKQGQYMTKAQAEAQGYHASKSSKACG
jgi:hypothetical protein